MIELILIFGPMLGLFIAVVICNYIPGEMKIHKDSYPYKGRPPNSYFSGY